jgi:hypothetical protein
MASLVLLPAAAPAVIVPGQLMRRALNSVPEEFFNRVYHINLLIISVWCPTFAKATAGKLVSGVKGVSDSKTQDAILFFYDILDTSSQ